MNGEKMMRKTKIFLFCVTALSIGFLGLSEGEVKAASNPNYGSSTEIDDLEYFGYVQSKSSYTTTKGNALNGYLRYQNGSGGDTGRLYTSTGTSRSDGTIRKRQRSYFDTLNPVAPQVVFNYGHTYVATSNPWPMARVISE